MVGAPHSCTAEQVVCVLICRLRKFFQDWRIRGLFSFQDLYVGLSPYSAPGVYSLLAGTELTDGVWYPRGGFGKVRASSACLCLPRSDCVTGRPRSNCVNMPKACSCR